MYDNQKKLNLTTIFILLLLFSIIYTIFISNSNNYNNIIYANSLTNNRVLYIDDSGKLATTEIEKEDIIRKQDLLNMIYPVGSIYISVNNVSPASFLGGSWEKIEDGYYLRASDSDVGDKLEAGLPNIIGTFQQGPKNIAANAFAEAEAIYGLSGAFLGSTYSNVLIDIDGAYTRSTNSTRANVVNFNASKSNPIYGNSNTVQPKSIKVSIWMRTK